MACPSQETMLSYLGGSLEQVGVQAIDDHLLECRECREHVLLARTFGSTYSGQAEEWWTEYVGREMLHLLAEVPEIIDEVRTASKAGPLPAVHSEAFADLPLLRSARTAAQRLAAATGEGFHQQVITQEQPPFDFMLQQFGNELRVGIRAHLADSSYGNCLARLEFLEGQACLYSRFVLIENGHGKCVLGSAETRSLRPGEGRLTVRLTPLETLQELSSAGEAACIPILERLIEQDDVRIRACAVQVLARIAGPWARPLLKRLEDDTDEDVRAAVRKALEL